MLQLGIYTVEPPLKDPLNEGHSNFDLSIKHKFCGLYDIMTIQSTSERTQPLYSGIITPKLAGPKVCITRRSTV